MNLLSEKQLKTLRQKLYATWPKTCRVYRGGILIAIFPCYSSVSYSGILLPIEADIEINDYILIEGGFCGTISFSVKRCSVPFDYALAKVVF